MHGDWEYVRDESPEAMMHRASVKHASARCSSSAPLITCQSSRVRR